LSVQYATDAELASYLKQDVDTSTATLALQTASALFSTRAQTWFAPTSTTWSTPGVGARQLYLPFRPIISVDAARIINSAGTTTVTDWKLIRGVLYRLAGWGVPGAFPPDEVQIDLTHGYATAGDDVKGAVLETAGAAYMSPDITVAQETIDDYTIKAALNAGGMSLSPAAQMLADYYRGTIAA
jgi:hypothetical protein